MQELNGGFAPAHMTADEVGTLVARAESLATEHVEEVMTDTVSMLRFRLGPEWYAVSVSDVREIFHDYAITPMPCVPRYVRGVVSVRGEIISVTDPALMMQVGRVELDGVTMPPAVVVVRGGLVTALVVDEIGDIAEVPGDAIEPPIVTIDRGHAEFISGTLHVDDALIGVLSVEKVLEPVVTGARYERQ